MIQGFICVGWLSQATSHNGGYMMSRARVIDSGKIAHQLCSFSDPWKHARENQQLAISQKLNEHTLDGAKQQPNHYVFADHCGV